MASERKMSVQDDSSSASAQAPAAAASAPAAAASSSAAAVPLRLMEELRFENLALQKLPIDKSESKATREVPGACFSLVSPTPVLRPRLVAYSADALKLLEIDPKQTERPEFAEYFSGNKIIPGSRPAAHCYAGHQFGHFSGQLGDGATMYLGEIVTSTGQRHELQLKGAGQTPYSRRADGRKVLRSSLREFLCSEGHHYLGIPTTRAPTIVTSDTRVERDQMYDGNVSQERATIISRTAASFIRFGSFEIAKGPDRITGRHGPSQGRTDILRTLLDYVVDTFYSDICAKLPTREQQYIAFFRELTRRTAVMVAKWQSVGWCHGVLNTDNMSIVGVTIDYGPFGFMEEFDPAYICNASDSEGRYRYEAQPEICGWNLHTLSESLAPIVPVKEMQQCVAEFEDLYLNEYNAIMRKKLGLGAYKEAAKEQLKKAGVAEATAASVAPASAAMADSLAADTAGDEELVAELLETMAKTGADWTNSFRCLSRLVPDDATSFERTLAYLVKQCSSIASRVAALAPRIPAHQFGMIKHLLATNPQMFHQPGMEEQLEIIQQELAREKQRTEVQKMTQAQKSADDAAAWTIWLNKYSQRLSSDLLSAQSLLPNLDASSLHLSRARSQNSVNPKYILRNWIAQMVIQEADKGQYEVVQECLERLKDPYDVEDRGEELQHEHEHAAAASSSSSAAAASSAMSSLADSAQDSSERPSTPERDERSHTNLPPKGTQCAIHWNKEKPQWASTLKVT